MPIIEALIKTSYEPVIASDGDALELLKKEFPHLKSYVLPSYKIKYAKKGICLKLNLFLSIPSILSAVRKEKEITHQLIENEGIEGVISDNRFGVFSKEVPSVYITHQLRVFSGITSFISTFFHRLIWQKFDECWVPDFEGISNYSGALGHLKKCPDNIKYMGVLSRFKRKKLKKKYALMVLLSGPEPQRTTLEDKLLKELSAYKGTILFVRGLLNPGGKIRIPNNIKIEDYLLADALEKALNQSDLVIARSGYSTIMDLAVLGKKAFFIPTPGQSEQQYLAKRLKETHISYSVDQQKFSLNKLKVGNGFNSVDVSLSQYLFDLFEGK